MAKWLFLTMALLAAVTLVGDADADNFTIEAKSRFMEEASAIDSTAAAVFAASLTDADWFETDPEVILDSFRAALEARQRFAWGKSCSDSLFYRYVLPLRVDDEPLQPYRRYFFEQLGPRLDSLTTITRAALEVNLWLGERVWFRSTDWADQGPLTTISCGFGRCGELMIITIDALRSVGIPARGVYVPFWAAFDNNHAWVEVLTEDGWKYIEAAGASNRFNKTWFSRTVLRAPILLTKDDKAGPGDRDAVRTRSGWSLNVTRNYIDPARLTVAFPDNWNENDRAWLAVFNFGTLRPLVQLLPADGETSMEIGHGDFTILGTFHGKLFIQPFTAQTGRETRLTLATENRLPQRFTLRFPEPPVQREPEPEMFPQWRLKVAAEMRKARKAQLNWHEAWMDSLAPLFGPEADELLALLKRAQGNEEEIAQAFSQVTEQLRPLALQQWALLSDENLRQVRMSALLRWAERLPFAAGVDEDDLPDLISPRIAYEYPPASLLPPAPMSTFTDLKTLRGAVAEMAPLIDSTLRQRPLPPPTLEAMLAAGVPIDTRNSALLWVDRLRRAGIPARKGTWSDWAEFKWSGNWLPLYPDDPANLGNPDAGEEARAHYEKPAVVRLSWKVGDTPPKFESEYLWLPIDDSGWPEFRKDEPISLREEDRFSIIELTPGEYFFTTGRRNSRGDIAAEAQIVRLQPGEERTFVLDLLAPADPPKVKALEMNLSDLHWKPKKRGVSCLLVIMGDNEPSIRTHGQAMQLAAKNLQVDVLKGLDKLDAHDLALLGLEDFDETSAPFVFFFDRDGGLLFSQAGYDLNLPNRVRNSSLEKE